MPNQIQKELELAKTKLLSTIQGTGLVKLSTDNVAMVEAMICNDSAYLKSGNREAGPIKKRNGEIKRAE